MFIHTANHELKGIGTDINYRNLQAQMPLVGNKGCSAGLF